MIEITKLDTGSKAQVNAFVSFQFRLYKDCPLWVPPFIGDVKTMLNRKKHPFHEHSDVDFFVARKGGEFVGRISAIENKPFNDYHDKKQAAFYLFECVDDQDVANALFERVFEWMRKRDLNRLVGPKGYGPLDGYGILIQGYEHRPMMTMMNYNYEYYPKLLENLGFEKEVDFVSAYLSSDDFKMPKKIHEIARKVEERGTFRVKNFRSKRELIAWSGKIGEMYNETFVNNWEYYPLTKREIKFLVDNIMIVADHRLIKVITRKDEIVGFLFAFPDVSDALQRQKGRITPWGIVDIFLDMKRTKWVSMNGAGILPRYQGRGGNALLYVEIEKTARGFGFEYVDMTQVAETAVQMRKDLKNLGGKFYKNHRVYQRGV